jgi:hypothetical protein
MVGEGLGGPEAGFFSRRRNFAGSEDFIESHYDEMK